MEYLSLQDHKERIEKGMKYVIQESSPLTCHIKTHQRPVHSHHRI